MEAHYEYLIRYLSDEFFIEMAHTPYEPYENFLDRFPETSPLMRDPNNYDLIIPLLASHAGCDPHVFGDKMAMVLYEPGEGRWTEAKLLGTTTPVVDDADYHDKKHMPVRFGIDTDLFRPIPMAREDDLLHVGFVGSHANPRRQIEEGIKPLLDMPGVKWMFFPGTWVNNGGEPEKIESLGGRKFLDRIVSGQRLWPGVPNMYNQLDVLVRIDNSYGYSFPTLEAAACGVPVIATNQGIDHLITEAGGGILLEADGFKGQKWPIGNGEELTDKLRKAIEFMRDHPKKRKMMGKAGREEIIKNWMWHDQIPAWRKFLREALK
jgi:glycosyltransferase involved in cell wall biosynthesis